MPTGSRSLRGPAGSRAPQRRGLLAPADAFSRSLARGLRRSVAERATAVWLGDVDGWLLAVGAALCAFGPVMVYSASEAPGAAGYGNSTYFFQNQALYLGTGPVLR